MPVRTLTTEEVAELEHAITARDVDLVEYLTDNHISGDSKIETLMGGKVFSKSVLVHLLFSKQADAVNFLIEQNPGYLTCKSEVTGSLISTENMKVRTLLLQMSATNQAELIPYLLEKGASFNDKVESAFGPISLWQVFALYGADKELSLAVTLSQDIDLNESIQGFSIFDLLRPDINTSVQAYLSSLLPALDTEKEEMINFYSKVGISNGDLNQTCQEALEDMLRGAEGLKKLIQSLADTLSVLEDNDEAGEEELAQTRNKGTNLMDEAIRALHLFKNYAHLIQDAEVSEQHKACLDFLRRHRATQIPEAAKIQSVAIPSALEDESAINASSQNQGVRSNFGG